MNNACIIWKKAGQTIDDRYLSLVLKSCPSAVGTVVKVEDDLEISANIGTPDLATMKSALDIAKDHEVCLWFASLTDHKVIKPEYLQPFVWKDEDKALMAVLMEGDFSKYSDPGKSDEWKNCFDKFVLPSLKDQATLAGGDWDAFLTRLKGDLFEQQMLGSASHRAAMLFIPFQGETIGHAMNELGAEYEWGSVSQTFGFDPNKKEEPKVEKKTGSFFNFGKKAATETKPDVNPETKPEDKPEEPKTEPDKTAVEGEWVTIPNALKGKAKKQHIRKVLGLKSGDQIPDGWFQDDFKVFVPKTKTIRDLKDLRSVVQPAATETAVKPTAKVENQITPPVISDKNKLGVMDFVVKRIGANANTIAVNPQKMQELENKVPSFSEATGVNIEDTFKLTFGDLKALQETYPTEMIILLMEYRRNYKASLQEQPATPETKTEPEKIVEEPKKVASGGGFFNFIKK